jgi:hypothetical protein
VDNPRSTFMVGMWTANRPPNDSPNREFEPRLGREFGREFVIILSNERLL